MSFDPNDIPDDPQMWRTMFLDSMKLVKELTRTVELLRHEIALLRRQTYGRKSEKLDLGQGLLFAEVPSQPPPTPPEPAVEPPVPPPPAKKKKGHGRSKLRSDLPRIRIEYPIPEDRRVCGCGHTLEKFGEEKTEQLEYKPSSLLILEHVRGKYACRACQDGVVTSEMPMQPIEKGIPGAGLLSQVLTSKYSDHLPLNRQEGIFLRNGVKISRSTMCGWVDLCADLLSPIVRYLKEQIVTGGKIHTDDTTVPVLDRQRSQTRTGRLWVYIGDIHHPFAVYDYTPTRQRDGPLAFLKGYRGYLQGDAYAGYNALYAGGDVVEVACWAHARRKFYDAKESDQLRAHIALVYIGELYDVEKVAAKLSPTERLALRREFSAPILVKLKTWLDIQRTQVLPKSLMGTAIGYAMNQWTALNRYLEHADLSIDNNQAERALRCIAVGRRNWTFAGSDEGAHRAAIIYSLVATCKMHGVDPFAYLRDVLTRISTHPASRIADLVPGRWLPIYRCPAQANHSPR